jgi:primosomal protein N' (replication factor Y)
MNRYVDVVIRYPLEKTFTYRLPHDMDAGPGRRLKVNFRGRLETAFPVEFHDREPEGFSCKDVDEVLDDAPVFDRDLLDLARFTASTYCSSPGEALSMALPSGTSPSYRFTPPFEVERESAPELSPEQQKVMEDILRGREKGENRHLLFGVTGSGKTEIYMELARRVMAEGRSVLVLVPEITLTSQIFERLYALFGEELVVYHSHLTKNQRLGHWLRFYRGEARIAVGTRSAVFMQAPDLGLIIIDEEQDPSYKEQSTPRYNARRIAFYRSHREKALLLMGSATPSLESFYAARKGIIGFHRLDTRYGGARLPEIEIVEMEHVREEGIISGPLRLHSVRAARQGKQSVLLLNRRGFAPLVICNNCSSVVECPHCSISMNFHRNGMMLCHYCGFTRPVPETCGECGSGDLARVGSGTQKVEDVIERTFPGMRIFRLDQDSTRRKGAVPDLLEGMRRGEIDILLGTQMVSKGFDFPGVTVVGVLLADIGMNLPDFRAGERIFSLLMQVAGRSGRREEEGKVIIQTLNADQPMFRHLLNHDYEGFYAEEIEARKMMGYPPFTRLVRLLLRGRDEEQVNARMNEIHRVIRQVTDHVDVPVQLLGPSAAPIERIKGQYRRHLIIKSTDINTGRKAALEAREVQLDRDMYLEIDVDPHDML